LAVVECEAPLEQGFDSVYFQLNDMGN